jgi:hypothetical protein
VLARCACCGARFQIEPRMPSGPRGGAWCWKCLRREGRA